MNTVLTLAGSDTSAGAGIQADLKTFQSCGVYGMTVITALTAQNTQGVHTIHPIPQDVVAAQIDAVMRDFSVHAWKTGMLANLETLQILSEKHEEYGRPLLVVDPVMAASQGGRLLDRDALSFLVGSWLPRATLCTPNHKEASLLTGRSIHSLDDMRHALDALLHLGLQNVLLKGGHLPETMDAIDLFSDGRDTWLFSSPRIHTQHTHGTGCTLASAIAAELAKGSTPLQAVQSAKNYITHALAHAETLQVTEQYGPLDHLLGQHIEHPRPKLTIQRITH